MNRWETFVHFCYVAVRFILDDSALYLSDKCETETVDLRRGKVLQMPLELCKNRGLVWVSFLDFIC